MQACKKLKLASVKTLATTLFTMEQAVLAGEVGCVSISPFAYELRAHSDSSYICLICFGGLSKADFRRYHDSDPNFDLFVQAQRYYEQHGIPTKVKACAFFTPEEALEMAGVNALTLPPDMLQELSDRKDFADKLESCLRFIGSDKNNISNGNGHAEPMTFANDQAKFLESFSQNGRGRAKTDDVKVPDYHDRAPKANHSIQSITVFCEFQTLAEAIVRDSNPSKVL